MPGTRGRNFVGLAVLSGTSGPVMDRRGCCGRGGRGLTHSFLFALPSVMDPALATLYLLLLQPPPGGPAPSDNAAADVTIICRNLEVVEVTWGHAHTAEGDGDFSVNVSLEWRYGQEPHQPCPRYFLSGDGLTSGCALPALPALLEVIVHQGTVPVFTRRARPMSFLQPSPPGGPVLHWTEDNNADTVHVTCSALPLPGLEYAVQHRQAGPGSGSEHWETSAPARSCDVPVGGVDRYLCYDFRVRATPIAAVYGLEARPSEWSPMTRWVPGPGGGPCPAPPTPLAKTQHATPASLTPMTLALATSLLLLLALWRLRRVKATLLPCIPDPRGGFRDLFEQHGGDFQDWIDYTEGVAAEHHPDESAATDPATEGAIVLEATEIGAGHVSRPSHPPH